MRPVAHNPQDGEPVARSYEVIREGPVAISLLSRTPETTSKLRRQCIADLVRPGRSNRDGRTGSNP